MFKVKDSRNISYTVELDAMMVCTCNYYKRNLKPCQHINFIITQVAKDSINRYEPDSLIIDEEDMSVLHKLLLKKLKKRYVKKNLKNILPLK